MKLHGVTAPEGEGIVLEVHLDIQRSNPAFEEWLVGLGFENDPFATFFPVGYVAHMTGRIKVLPREIHDLLPEVNAIVTNVVSKAIAEELALYAEVELVREVHRFEAGVQSNASEIPIDPASMVLGDRGGISMRRSLDSLRFFRSGKFGGAKSDVHVEFPKGKVPLEVREYLLSKEFYWVSTPATAQCGAEEIATLQTSTYEAGKRVTELLSQNPLPGCTAIHLEQKLSMIATNYNLTMPEIIDVKTR